MGKMRRNLRGQYNQGVIISGDNPKKLVTGFATQAAKEPLIAKTIKIAIIDQFVSIPHRFFNFSI